MKRFETPQALCASLDWGGLNVTWIDRTGMVRLPDGKLARIDLVQGPVDHYTPLTVTVIGPVQGPVNHYTALMVTVISAFGPLDSKFFPFRDSLAGVAYGDEFYITRQHDGWAWRPMAPATTVPLTRAIVGYISFFLPGDEANRLQRTVEKGLGDR